MKSEFSNGFPIFGMQNDEVAKRNYKTTMTKGMTWLKEKLKVNRMEVIPLMIIIFPNDVNDDG